jgi:hypothetical protein
VRVMCVCACVLVLLVTGVPKCVKVHHGGCLVAVYRFVASECVCAHVCLCVLCVSVCACACVCACVYVCVCSVSVMSQCMMVGILSLCIALWQVNVCALCRRVVRRRPAIACACCFDMCIHRTRLCSSLVITYCAAACACRFFVTRAAWQDVLLLKGWMLYPPHFMRL